MRPQHLGAVVGLVKPVEEQHEPPSRLAVHADRGLNAFLAPEDAVVGAVPARERGEERDPGTRGTAQDERDADGAARQRARAADSTATPRQREG